MIGLGRFMQRNIKMFLKDKGLFFTSLITPLILLVLYITFLGNVYEDSFVQMTTPFGITLPDDVLGACVGGQLFSSLLAVCTVTVSFCANMLMVQDKVTGAHKDLTVSPVKPHTMALGYYLATLISTLLICLVAVGACLLYLGRVGWYLSGQDVLYILADVGLLVLFGTALSSVINFFLSTQGQISAVGSIVSSCYGFICGAYMPISQFSEGLQKVLSFLPGTYGTSLLRNHALRGALEEMNRLGVPSEGMDSLKDMLDCSITFFDHTVSIGAMYAVVGGFSLTLILLYVILNAVKFKKR